MHFFSLSRLGQTLALDCSPSSSVEGPSPRPRVSTTTTGLLLLSRSSASATSCSSSASTGTQGTVKEKGTVKLKVEEDSS